MGVGVVTVRGLSGLAISMARAWWSVGSMEGAAVMSMISTTSM